MSDAKQSAEVQEVLDYVPGKWFKVKSLEQMEHFYWSRLPFIREAAKALGYAVAVHGSMRRDFDVIAVKWVEVAGTPEELARAVAIAACGLCREEKFPYQWTKKPAGRIATSIPICWIDLASLTDRVGIPNDGHLDLSIVGWEGV